MSLTHKCYVWSEKLVEEARQENAVNRINTSCLTVMTAVLLLVCITIECRLFLELAEMLIRSKVNLNDLDLMPFVVYANY